MLRVKRPILVSALAWTVLIGAAAGIALRASYLSTLEYARVAARVAFEKDLTYRLWNTMRGGVYVPVNEHNRPNPHLDVPDRDLMTTSGRMLTMINPAYMTRQVYEIQKFTAQVQGHITSLDPIRPENKPDQWENDALLAFAKGKKEVSTLTIMDGKPYMRIMRPVLVDEYCLKCHAKQGYKAGEIRGGISASVPLMGHLEELGLQWVKILAGYGAIWGIGLAGIVVVGRRLQRSLLTERQARQEAETASLVKDEFLANMSHEIRTPLNGMLGMLQLLKAEVPEEERAEYLGMAYESGQRLLNLLNDILDFSRLGSAGFELQQRPFCPQSLLNDAATLFQASCLERGLSLAVHADESLPRTLLGDEAHLRQALFNLVGNAIKFTPKGSITLEAWARSHSYDPTRQRLYLSITDTGIGIPDEKISVIFDRFTQVDGSYTRQYQGAGLGLAIVKRLMGHMGGSLSLSSEPGQGSQFILQVPLRVPAEENAACKERRAPGKPALRLLLAEDEEVSALALGTLLTKAGHAVVRVQDGEAAVRATKEGCFDCVLMDIQMPVMNGVDAVQAIRALEAESGLGRLPIIALTAYALPGDREHFLDSGMDGYVTKPVQMDQLEAELARLCPGVPETI